MMKRYKPVEKRYYICGWYIYVAISMGQGIKCYIIYSCTGAWNEILKSLNSHNKAHGKPSLAAV